jgi:hypothetical protein
LNKLNSNRLTRKFIRHSDVFCVSTASLADRTGCKRNDPDFLEKILHDFFAETVAIFLNLLAYFSRKH